jgi:hypothetical protein
LNQSTTNIPSECRIANIVRDHAMILPGDATPKPDEIFGKDRCVFAATSSETSQQRLEHVPLASRSKKPEPHPTSELARARAQDKFLDLPGRRRRQ